MFIRPPGAGSWWSEVSQLRLVSVSSAPLPSFTSRGETMETLYVKGTQPHFWNHTYYLLYFCFCLFVCLCVQPAMVAGPHARSNWVFSGYDCNPDVPWDHRMCIVSGFTCLCPYIHDLSIRWNTRCTFFPLCSDLGYEEGLSTLGMVSGLFGAVWSTGWVWASW